MLTCEGLSLQKRDNVIFANVGFSLLKGACLIIQGCNGSGKTSLLKR